MEEEKYNWDGHKEVKDLISRVPELHEMNARFEKAVEKEKLEYENYLENWRHDYEGKYKGKPDKKASDEKEAFDDVMWSFVFYKHELKKQSDERPFTGLSVKEEIFEYAKKYLDSKFIHNSFLTNSILAQVIDTELIPLEYEVGGITHPMATSEVRAARFVGAPVKWSNLLPYPWNKLVSAGLSLIFLIIGIFIIIFFVSADLNWLAWIFGILFAWHYIGKIFLSANSVKTKRKLAGLGANLKVIRDEIGSHSYDGKVIAERMKKLESDGLYVHSLVYPLLELSIKS